jgi:hypothetical protein
MPVGHLGTTRWYAVSVKAEPIEEHKESGIILDLIRAGSRRFRTCSSELARLETARPSAASCFLDWTEQLPCHRSNAWHRQLCSQRICAKIVAQSEDRFPAHPNRSWSPEWMAGMGHEDQFTPPRLRGRCVCSQGTCAGTRGKAQLRRNCRRLNGASDRLVRFDLFAILPVDCGREVGLCFVHSHTFSQ